MKLLCQVTRDLISMFIADARMSLAILAVVSLAAVILGLEDGSGYLGGVVLTLGSLGVLIGGVLSAAKTVSRKRARGHDGP